MMLIGKGYEDRLLSEPEIQDAVASALANANLSGQRVLIIIPDNTRTAPLPQMFRLFHKFLSSSVSRLDYLIALGPPPPLGEEAINKLVGVTAEERAGEFAGINILNHRWDLPETFINLGQITSDEIAEITGGLMSQP